MNETVNYIKSLGIDMISKAGSGHPGIVLGAAPIIYTLFSKHLLINPENPNWYNKDRFILSAGHGSALLYATLYLSGYDISLDDLQNFRNLNSKTPGHPEIRITPGVEMTTGPLGEGLASAVGVALSEKYLSTTYHFNDRKLINFNTYVLCSDGDLMEGVSYEACSLAGHLQLNNLIVLYDSNDITLDGKLSDSFNENIEMRFKAMNWDYIKVNNGNDLEQISEAISNAKNNDKPTIIEVKTIIGAGSLLENTNEVHGKTLDKRDIKQIKAKLGIFTDEFKVPHKIRNDFSNEIKKNSHDKYLQWEKDLKLYIKEFPNNAQDIKELISRKAQIDLNNIEYNIDDKNDATRNLNLKVMDEIAKYVPTLIGGSADLSSSTKAYLPNFDKFTSNNYLGKNIYFGIREHAMGAVMNGIALTGLRPFGSTFLTFSDFMKPAIRLAALMKLPTTFIFSHDAINIGSDGPTHQPIEQLVSLRSIPNMTVYRPADLNEIIGSWHNIINNNRPACLVLSRKETNLLSHSSRDDVSFGGYIVNKEINKLNGIMIATGSEVSLAIDISKKLFTNYKIDFRVVSMPSIELFEKQTLKYKNEILPKGYPIFVIEEASGYSWYQFVQDKQHLFTIDTFGASGSTDDIENNYGFNVDYIVEKIMKNY